MKVPSAAGSRRCTALQRASSPGKGVVSGLGVIRCNIVLLHQVGMERTVPPLPEQSRDRRTASTPVLALKLKHRPATRKPQPACLPDRSMALQLRPLTRPALSCPSAARKPDETHDLLASKAYFLRLFL